MIYYEGIRDGNGESFSVPAADLLLKRPKFSGIS
jgi:hypothetical protein